MLTQKKQKKKTEKKKKKQNKTKAVNSPSWQAEAKMKLKANKAT